MSQPAESYEVASLSDADLTTLLERLDGDEHLVSKQRRRLHDRIDNPNGWGGGTLESAGRSLTELRQEERELSERRLQLHRQINELRLERSRRIARSHLSPAE